MGEISHLAPRGMYKIYEYWYTTSTGAGFLPSTVVGSNYGNIATPEDAQPFKVNFEGFFGYRTQRHEIKNIPGVPFHCLFSRRARFLSESQNLENHQILEYPRFHDISSDLVYSSMLEVMVWEVVQ